jgi:hypothetical protein
LLNEIRSIRPPELLELLDRIVDDLQPFCGSLHQQPHKGKDGKGQRREVANRDDRHRKLFAAAF